MDESVVGRRVIFRSFVDASDFFGEPFEVVGPGGMFFGNEFGFDACGFEKSVFIDEWPIEGGLLGGDVAMFCGKA